MELGNNMDKTGWRPDLEGLLGQGAPSEAPVFPYVEGQHSTVGALTIAGEPLPNSVSFAKEHGDTCASSLADYVYLIEESEQRYWRWCAEQRPRFEGKPLSSHPES